jgi:hypothetical protein
LPILKLFNIGIAVLGGLNTPLGGLLNRRDLIMSKQKWQKASDVFGSSDPAFSKKVIFDKAFPEIDDIKIEVIETSELKTSDTLKSEQYQNLKRTYGKTIGEYIDCHNKFCYNGGFSIGSIIRDMVNTKQIVKEDAVFCQGYEGSPKGRKRNRSCLHYFSFRVEIKYKENISPRT